MILPACPSSDCGIFDRIIITTQPLGGTLISWGLRPGFRAADPFYFYVDFGRSGTDEWEALNSSPIVNDCAYMDINQRYFDQLADFYYRIRLVLPNEVDPSTHKHTEFRSRPQQANGNWIKRDWLIARDICRKEYLLQRKRTNITARGYILKRKRWGTSCPQCKDFDTDEVSNSQCSVCYGTGFVDGYFNAIPYTITVDAVPHREFKQEGTVSMTNNIVLKGRAVAYPYMDTKDVFVRQDNGERFIIRSISNLAELGGIPLVVAPELRLAPTTDIVYQVPLTAYLPSSSSTVPEEAGSLDPNCTNYRVESTGSDW